MGTAIAIRSSALSKLKLSLYFLLCSTALLIILRSVGHLIISFNLSKFSFHSLQNHNTRLDDSTRILTTLTNYFNSELKQNKSYSDGTGHRWYLAAFNRMGKGYTTIDTFKKELEGIPASSYKTKLWKNVLRMDWIIKNTAKENHVNRRKVVKFGEHKLIEIKLQETKKKVINIVTIACGGSSRDQALVMIKSAVFFSQDAHLTVTVFTDNSTIVSLGQGLLNIKWMVNQLGWDFSFEILQEAFPYENITGPSFRNLWKPCATQRLFYPSLLPHLDSVIHLDADTIVLSNLTEMWSNFDRNMFSTELAAMSANTEYPALGFYNKYSAVPYYGFGGLNAGVMLMNLTRMRQFRIEERSIAAYTLYKDKMVLADQDIYNIIFHTYPELIHLLDCTYNLNWVHCGQGPPQLCIHNPKPGPICFCYSAETRGVRLVHGNMGTFFTSFEFLVQLNERFTKLNLLKDSVEDTIEELMEHFDTLKTPCFFLSSKGMYGNALNYIQRLPTA